MEATMEQATETTATSVSAPDVNLAPDTTSTAPDVDIKQSAMKRDVKAVREQFDKIAGRRMSKKQEPKQAATVEQKTDVEPVKTESKVEPAKGKYVLGDGDSKIELDDPDGFLGYKSPEELKKAAANQIRRIQMDKKWLQEAESKVLSERQRAEAASAELVALKAEIERLKTAQPKAEPVKPKTDEIVREKQYTIAEAPQPPALPDIPQSQMDWTDEHHVIAAKYQKDRADYEKKLVEWVHNSVKAASAQAVELAKSGVAVDTNNPLVKDMAEIKRVVSELQQITGEVKKTKDQLETERRVNEYWDSINEFQRMHPEVATPASMKELHKQIWDDGVNYTWMDYVAKVNGLERPNTSDANAWNNYYTTRLAVTQKYLDGDKDVVTKCTQAGVEPPVGYREYFKAAETIRDIDTEHRRLIEQGLLGPKSTRHMAWEHLSKSKLTDQIKTLEQKAHSNGASTVIEALKRHDAEHAVTLPADLPQSGSTPFSEAQVIEMLKNKAENRNNPEFRAMLEQLTTKRKKPRG